ncbi:MAG: phytoene desaturase family protein [Bacillota bacterium]
MNKQDIIIIGAGIGGLTAAIELSCQNYNVTVIEKNSYAGGKVERFQDSGYSFEPGPSLFMFPEVFYELFKRAGKNLDDYLQLNKIDPEWQGFFADGRRINLFNDPTDTRLGNSSLDYDNQENLNKYLEYGKGMYHLVDKIFFQAGLDTNREVLNELGIFKSFRGFDLFLTLNDSIWKFFSNSYLKEIMNYFSYYAGSSPYRAPAAISIFPYLQHRYGLWYPTGGIYRLVEALQKLAEELGVKFQFNSLVKDVKIVKEQIKGVITESGEIYTGDHIISNMEVIPFYQKITEEDESFMKNFSKYEPSSSAYIMLLALKEPYSWLSHHNIFFSNDSKNYFKAIFEEYRLPEDPTLFLSLPARTDKNRENNFESIKITVPVPYIESRDDSKTINYSNFRNVILNKLEKMGMKNLKENIVYEKTLQPQDIADRYNSNRGSIYGVVADKVKNQGMSIPKKSTKYSNLYFVGGTVNPGATLPLVAISSRLVTEMITSNNNS